VDLVSVAPPVARRAAQVRRGSLNDRFWPILLKNSMLMAWEKVD